MQRCSSSLCSLTSLWDQKVLRPPLIYATGLNFRSHAAEVGLMDSIGKYPIFTMKSSSSVVTPRWETDVVTVVIPKQLKTTPEVDYEGELAVLIGTTCKDVPEDEVHRVVAGFT